MSTLANQQSVVVGVDGSAPALAAARWAGAIAARRAVRLEVVSVVPTFDYSLTAAQVADADLLPTLRMLAKKHADAAVTAVRADQPDLEITQANPEGVPADELVAAGEGARLVVVAANTDSRLATLLLGSTALRVANKSACPVAVWRGDFGTPLPDTRPVLVGVDGSPDSNAAIGEAFELAALLGAGVLAVHAWAYQDLSQWSPRPESWDALAEQEHTLLGERLAGWCDKFPDVEVTRLVVRDSPTKALLQQAGEAQAVVTGSHGHNRVTGLLLGSTSQNLLHHAPCPVLVTRA